MFNAMEYMFYTAFVACVALNLLLFYIVKRYTSKTMKVFGNLIIQTIIVDIMTSTVFTVVQLTVESTNGFVFFGSGSSWFPLKGKWQCSPVVLFAVMNNIGFWSVPIQAIYRYILIVRKRKIPQGCSLMVYGTVGILITMVTLPTAVLSMINSPDLNRLQLMGFWRDKQIDTMCVINILTWPVLTYLIGMMIIECSGVVVLVWMTAQLNKTMQQAQAHFSDKTKQAHKEMTRKLFAQAAIPIVMTCFLVIICGSIFVLPNYYGGLMVALLLPYPWIVVLNPFVTLCCIKQYRVVAVSILRGRCMQIASNMSVSSEARATTVIMDARSGPSTVPIKDSKLFAPKTGDKK